MNRIVGRTVLITGATAGIGEACARELAGRGARLVILGRRKERLFELAEALMKEHDVEVQARVVDVTDRAAVEALREDLADLDFSPDVIVNNAGKALGFHRTWEADPADWDEMIDTNLKGLLYVTRAFLPGMVERNRGHVVNIGSTAGRWAYPKGNVYASTKFAVAGLSEGINMDLAGTKVRVSSIDPGLVETEFSEVRFHGDRERAEKVYQGYTPLTPGDIADIVAYVINAPEHVDIFNVVVMPTDQRHSLIVHKEEGGG